MPIFENELRLQLPGISPPQPGNDRRQRRIERSEQATNRLQAPVAAPEPTPQATQSSRRDRAAAAPGLKLSIPTGGGVGRGQRSQQLAAAAVGATSTAAPAAVSRDRFQGALNDISQSTQSLSPIVQQQPQEQSFGLQNPATDPVTQQAQTVPVAAQAAPQVNPVPTQQARQPVQTQQATPESVLPEGAIEIIRGGPRYRNGSGNAGAAGSFQRSFAIPGENGGSFREVGPPPSATVQRQIAASFDSDPARAAQASANVRGLAPGLADPLVQQASFQRGLEADQQSQRQRVNADQQLQTQRLNANRDLSREERDSRQQSENRSANATSLQTITDEFGAEQLVIFDPATGTQRPVRDEQAETIASAEREIRQANPDATDEEIQSFLVRKFGGQ